SLAPIPNSLTAITLSPRQERSIPLSGFCIQFRIALPAVRSTAIGRVPRDARRPLGQRSASGPQVAARDDSFRRAARGAGAASGGDRTPAWHQPTADP